MPSISSLVDANSVTLNEDESKNTTLISAKTTNTYKVTFSESMDITSIDSDTLYMECDGVDQTINSIVADTNGSDDIADNEFIITMKNQLPGYTDCTLVFTDEIADLDGDYLTEAEYTFTTKCSSTTTFEDSTAFDACWATQNLPSSATTSFSNDLVMNFTSVNSYNNATMPFIYKLVDGDFEVVMHVSNRNADEGTEEIGLMVTTETPDLWGDSVHIGVYYSAGFGDENVYANEYESGSAQTIATAYTYTASNLYFKVVRTNNDYNFYYSSDGSSWTTYGSTYSNVTQIGDTAAVGIYGATGNTKGDFSVTIDSFIFNSGNAVEQD